MLPVITKVHLGSPRPQKNATSGKSKSGCITAIECSSTTLNDWSERLPTKIDQPRPFAFLTASVEAFWTSRDLRL